MTGNRYMRERISLPKEPKQMECSSRECMNWPMYHFRNENCPPPCGVREALRDLMDLAETVRGLVKVGGMDEAIRRGREAMRTAPAATPCPDGQPGCRCQAPMDAPSPAAGTGALCVCGHHKSLHEDESARLHHIVCGCRSFRPQGEP